MIIHEIKADLARRGCSEIIHLTQGDTNSHLIRFKITKHRRRWIPPKGLQAVVHYSNTYGSGGTYDTLSDGSPAWHIAEHDLCVILVPQAMALPGSVHVVVTLLCGGEALSAIHLQLMVEGLASAVSPVLANYSSITDFLPRPDTAEKGQFFAAETVSDGGEVLTVKATDALSDSSTSPTASVSATGDGAKITITDKNGTTTATITNGQDGITPHIGSNRNWFIGSTDTGIGSQGEKGAVGPEGPQGPQGEKGDPGPAGTSGKSAYQYAQEGGYTGTEHEFTAKLAAEGYGHVAQSEPPEDTNLLWLDTDDTSEDGAPVAAQPDWNATEGNVGYIRNRTHWEHSVEIIPETTVDFSQSTWGSFSPGFEIMEGQQYRITCNGETSICSADMSSGIPMLMAVANGKTYGIVNNTLAGGDGNGMLLAWYDNSTDAATLSIEECTIQKIPERYLPDSMNNYIVKVTQEEWDTRDTTENIVLMSQLSDNFIDVLYAGGDVWLDLSGIQDDQKWETPGYAKVLTWAINADGNKHKGCYVYAYIHNGYRVELFVFVFPGSQSEPTT